MQAAAAYLAANRTRIQGWLRAVAGPGEPLCGEALVAALADALADSGLEARAPTRPERAIVATGGIMRRRRLLLLLHNDEPDSQDEPGGARALLVACLAALAAVRATCHSLPLGVVLVCEQDRTWGSLSLASLTLPAADYCLWDGGGYNGEHPWLALGSHGLVRLRLRLAGPGGATGLGAVIANPAWRLAWALAALKSPDEEVLIPRFYEPVREAQAWEIEALHTRTPDLAALIASSGGQPLLGLEGPHLPLVQAFSPAVSIVDLGVEAARGHLPTAAWAELVLTVVPMQTPEAIAQALEQRLADAGLGDAVVEVLSSYPGLETPASAPLVSAACETLTPLAGLPPVLLPFGAGPAPLARLGRRRGAAAIGIGVGRGDWPMIEQRVEIMAAALAELIQRLPGLPTG